MASFGENLRRERELRGVSLRDIADATKISVRFLQAIEQDRMEILPGGLFPRAFVRQYARHLGLDAERLVADFVYCHKEETEEPARPRRPDTPPRRSLLALAIASAGGVLLIWKGGARAPKDTVSLTVPPPSTFAQGPVYPAPAQASSAETNSQGLVLTLNARQSCWVAVQVDGQNVLNRVLHAGETETLQAEGEIVLSVGNAGGLAFRVNDRAGMPLGKSGEVRRNIVITHKSLPSFVEDAPPVHVSQRS